MIQALLGDVVHGLHTVEWAFCECQGAFPGEVPASVEGPLRRALKLLSECTAPLMMSRTQSRILRVEAQLDTDAKSYPAMMHQLVALREAIEDDLNETLLLYVGPAKAKYFLDEPATIFPNSWPKFPSAHDDMTEAARCYACGRHTAAVYHCVGVMQYGLYALAQHLGVQTKKPLEYENWRNIVDVIEKKIGEYENQQGHSRQELEFLAGAASHFRFVKDSLRNDVGHIRRSYDEGQAHSVFTHTVELLEHLATRLEEPSVAE
ncbi:MAG: hypothetical protein AB1689_08770 [Thermodesulfobacteriota bacterium]